jgi:hypothetical protein
MPQYVRHMEFKYSPGMPHLDKTYRWIVSFMYWTIFPHVKSPPTEWRRDNNNKLINLCTGYVFSGVCLQRSGVLQYSYIIIIIIILQLWGEESRIQGFYGETREKGTTWYFSVFRLSFIWF